jgi:hypothetical protein
MNPDELKQLNTLVRQNSKPALTKMCLEKNLSVKGTKHDLAVRILGMQMRPSVAVEETDRPLILIRKNKHGRYVHDCTNLVFDKQSRKVIGKEDNHGHVLDLRRADIQVCRQYKFQYCLPECLDPPSSPLYRKDDSTSADAEDASLSSDDEDISEED